MITVTVTYTVWGTWYYSSTISLGSPAHAFVETPQVSLSLNNSGSACVLGGASSITKTSLGTTSAYRPSDPGTVSVSIGVIAVGRWK